MICAIPRFLHWFASSEAPVYHGSDIKTFCEVVEASPVGWLIGVGAACFVAGLLVASAIIQARNSERRPGGGENLAKNATEPSRPPAVEPPVRPTETINISPIRSATPAESGNMELTVQQFVRRYLELGGRFAEQEAFLKRADRKRVRWKVTFAFPASRKDRVVLYFDVPAESPNKESLRRGPLSWASFPASFHDRVYSLNPGDTVEISGILNVFFDRIAVIEGDDFEVVAAPDLTHTRRTKKSH